jgi:hypothetical protein
MAHTGRATTSYDPYQALTEDKATLAGQSSPFYDLVLGYDAVYNLTNVTTTLLAAGSHPAGSE